MSQEVYTAVKGEFVQAQLPLYTGERKVRAARIVAVGLGPVSLTTRLALEGGAHVDVSKFWMQRHGATAGQYYVQDQTGDSSEVIAAEVFEQSYVLADQEAAGEGVQSAAPSPFDFAKLHEHPSFVEWFKDKVNAHHFAETLENLYYRLHIKADPDSDVGKILYSEDRATGTDVDTSGATGQATGAQVAHQAMNAQAPQRPTIDELEKMLNSEEKHDIRINPDGSITAVPSSTEDPNAGQAPLPSEADLDAVAEEKKAAEETGPSGGVFGTGTGPNLWGNEAVSTGHEQTHEQTQEPGQ